MVVLSWIMTATISLKIAFLMLVTIPILGGVLIFIAKKAHPHFIAVFDEYDVLNNTVQENVNAARVVKAYVREEYENGKFHKISQKVFELFTKAEMLVSWNAPPDVGRLRPACGRGLAGRGDARGNQGSDVPVRSVYRVPQDRKSAPAGQ